MDRVALTESDEHWSCMFCNVYSGQRGMCGARRTVVHTEAEIQRPAEQDSSTDQKVSQTARVTRKEGNVLFNDTLNTFYLRLYGIRHMVKNHSDRERGNLLPPHRQLFPISSKGSFICIIPQTGQYIPQPLLHQSWSTGWNYWITNSEVKKKMLFISSVYLSVNK